VVNQKKAAKPNLTNESDQDKKSRLQRGGSLDLVFKQRAGGRQIRSRVISAPLKFKI